LAERAMKQNKEAGENLAYMYRLATSRKPDSEVSSILMDSFDGHLERYQSDRAAALQLVSTGESLRDETLDIAELAAYQMVASLILNLDVTITKD